MEELEKYRKDIEEIDCRIFELLKMRFSIVEKVGAFKKMNNLPVRNVERENTLVDGMANKFSLDKDFIRKFYRVLFNNSYKIEK